jgi:hypothetical protein
MGRAGAGARGRRLRAVGCRRGLNTKVGAPASPIISKNSVETCHHVGTNISPPPPQPPPRSRQQWSTAGWFRRTAHTRPASPNRQASLWPNAHQRGALGSQLGAGLGGKAEPAGGCGGDGGTARRRPRGDNGRKARGLREAGPCFFGGARALLGLQ